MDSIMTNNNNHIITGTGKLDTLMKQIYHKPKSNTPDFLQQLILQQQNKAK